MIFAQMCYTKLIIIVVILNKCEGLFNSERDALPKMIIMDLNGLYRIFLVEK
jgi:hypothetical protein